MTCPSCGEEFERLGMHWYHGACPYPEIDRRTRETVIGLLMGDASIPTTPHANNILHVPMTNRTFLEWLDDELGVLTTGGVTLKKTATELAANNAASGFSPNAEPENYHDMYTIWTRTHPFFTELRETWYPGGEKRFPDDLELTPTVAKFWYLCDGFLDFGDWGRPRLGIKAANETERAAFLESLFVDAGFSPTFQRYQIRFSCDDTERLVEWLGEAPPGFAYKWGLDSKDEYDRLKRTAYEEHATRTLT